VGGADSDVVCSAGHATGVIKNIGFVESHRLKKITTSSEKDGPPRNDIEILRKYALTHARTNPFGFWITITPAVNKP
jgi:hypothetical protein